MNMVLKSMVLQIYTGTASHFNQAAQLNAFECYPSMLPINEY